MEGCRGGGGRRGRHLLRGEEGADVAGGGRRGDRAADRGSGRRTVGTMAMEGGLSLFSLNLECSELCILQEQNPRIARRSSLAGPFL